MLMPQEICLKKKMGGENHFINMLFLGGFLRNFIYDGKDYFNLDLIMSFKTTAL